jgi:branched chain amino acid efflux pump
MMPMLAIAALAAITYAFRIAGPLLADRVTVAATAQRLFTSAAAVLLVALAATSALTAGHDFAGWARPAGVAAAGLLAARRAPFPVVVLVAASVTALLRLAGIHLPERARGSSPNGLVVRFRVNIPRNRTISGLGAGKPGETGAYVLDEKRPQPVTSGRRLGPVPGGCRRCARAAASGCGAAREPTRSSWTAGRGRRMPRRRSRAAAPCRGGAPRRG